VARHGPQRSHAPPQHQRNRHPVNLRLNCTAMTSSSKSAHRRSSSPVTAATCSSMTPPSTSFAQAAPSTPLSACPTEPHRHQRDGVPAGSCCQIGWLQALLPAALPLSGPSLPIARWVKQWCLLVPRPLSPSLPLSLFLRKID
jgi:hypothetical protein